MKENCGTIGKDRKKKKQSNYSEKAKSLADEVVRTSDQQ